MSPPEFDRCRLRFRPLAERRNRVSAARDFVSPDAAPQHLSAAAEKVISETVVRIREARRQERPVILAFGAHTIKNGLAPVLLRLMERGWVTHLATNGAGIIHDWEFAFQGMSSEDVRANIARGQFGLWQETGYYLNLALAVGAFEGRGYGEAVGAMIEHEGLQFPAPDSLAETVRQEAEANPERAAAAADLLAVMRAGGVPAGWLTVAHPRRACSVQAAAYRLRMPFTGHPMIGHDIIYMHPLNHGAAVGRAALRDFLRFAHAVSRLRDGVYLSIGSAVMSPMIFEKAFAMAQNLAWQEGEPMTSHFLVVVDLAEAPWDWQRDGEPPENHPAYYLRYCKTFSRMGGTMRYAAADNRDFLLALTQALD